MRYKFRNEIEINNFISDCSNRNIEILNSVKTLFENNTDKKNLTGSWILLLFCIEESGKLVKLINDLHKSSNYTGMDFEYHHISKAKECKNLFEKMNKLIKKNQAYLQSLEIETDPIRINDQLLNEFENNFMEFRESILYCDPGQVKRSIPDKDQLLLVWTTLYLFNTILNNRAKKDLSVEEKIKITFLRI
ncbi:MAG: hypothetical protein HPY73_05755 [Methanomassiliicoccales archaeon]|nr:MAG: hypothetical protein HPY73_05755 [Methanomassiliicoccales archaeon]